MVDPQWQECRNILCVRLDQIGDVLMTTPALRALREGLPLAKLTLLTSSAAAQAAASVPMIDEYLVYDAPWMKATAGKSDPFADVAFINKLNAQCFDAAVIFTVFSQSALPAALMCHLAGIPLCLAHCRENPYRLLTHWIKDTETTGPGRHEVKRQLDLVWAVGCTSEDKRLEVRIRPADMEHVRGLFRDNGVDPSQPVLLVHPGASAPSRRYPMEHFSAVTRALGESFGPHIVFTGSADEGPLIDEIRGRAGVPSLTLEGELSFGELCAAIALARVVLTNNSAPAHIAAATGTPVVDLYALTNPQHTPWMVPRRVLFHDVPCKYCYKSVCPLEHHDCLRKVLPETVVNAVLDIMQRPNAIEPDGLPALDPMGISTT